MTSLPLFHAVYDCDTSDKEIIIRFRRNRAAGIRLRRISHCRQYSTTRLQKPQVFQKSPAGFSVVLCFQKDALPALAVFKRRELTEKVQGLTEEIEDLKNEETVILLIRICPPGSTSPTASPTSSTGGSTSTAPTTLRTERPTARATTSAGLRRRTISVRGTMRASSNAGWTTRPTRTAGF